jgi:hypothetical protein
MICTVLKLREEKRTSVRVRGGKVDSFLPPFLCGHAVRAHQAHWAAVHRGHTDARTSRRAHKRPSSSSDEKKIPRADAKLPSVVVIADSTGALARPRFRAPARGKLVSVYGRTRSKNHRSRPEPLRSNPKGPDRMHLAWRQIVPKTGPATLLVACSADIGMGILPLKHTTPHRMWEEFSDPD